MNKKKIEEVENISFTTIFDRINSNSGIIFIDTPEETRLIREISKHYKDDSVQFWSIGQGLHIIEKKKINIDRFYPHKFPSNQARLGKDNKLDTRTSPLNAFSVIEEDCREKLKPDEDPDTRNIYILRDLDKFLKDPVCLRRLKDLVYLCSTSASCIIVTGYGITVPIDLEKDSIFIKLNYPTKSEIINIILKDTRNMIEEHNKVCSPENKIDDMFDDEEVARACGGLTEDQIINTLQYSMNTFNKIDISTIIEEKRSIINKSDILEYWNCKDSLDDIGGFKKIKEWIAIQKTVMHNVDNAIEFQTEPPKAIMLLGVQGSGKTAASKAIAQNLKVSLLKFDIGKVFAGLVGESIAPDEEFIFYTKEGTIYRLTAEEAYDLQPQNVYIPSSTSAFKSELKQVTGFIKHIRTSKLMKITTISGRSIKVTEDHSLFTISGSGSLKECKPTELTNNSVIVIPKNIQEPTNPITKFDLLDFIDQFGDQNKWLLCDAWNYYGEKIKEWTDNKSWHGYEVENRPLILSKIMDCYPDKCKIKGLGTHTIYNNRLTLTPDLMELFGWYSAEGSISNNNMLRLHINKNENDYITKLIDKCGYKYSTYPDGDSNGVTIFFGDTALKNIFNYLALIDKNRVPVWIFNTTLINRTSYLKGFFSGDGGNTGTHIEVSQKNELFLKDIMFLLSTMGISSSIYPRRDGCFRLNIHSSIYKQKYSKLIGFSQTEKQELLLKNIEDNSDSWGHKFPLYDEMKKSPIVSKLGLLSSNTISYKNAIKINPNIEDWDFDFDRIKTIEVCEEQPEFVYDISVKDNENFICGFGGILCHNSEKRMRQALTLADAVGGIIVIDELDKGLSGAGSSDKTDGGTTNRVIGTLLTWLNEEHPGLLLIATANDITNLRNNHPELLRKGRFDEIWFSDVPNIEEREEIFRIHIKKRKRDPEKFDLKELAAFEYVDNDKQKYTTTGAEIESAVKDALRNKFAKGGGKKIEIGSKEDINTKDILDCLKLIKPITKIGKTTISTMRKWSEDNATNVSAGIAAPEKKKTYKSKINLRTDEVDI